MTDLFFEQHFPADDFLQSQRSKENWSKACVPLSRWQELVYVGFAGENPPQLIHKNYVFVKANAICLKKVFIKLSKEALDETKDVLDLMHGSLNDSSSASSIEVSRETSEVTGATETSDEPPMEMLDLNIGGNTRTVVTAPSALLSAGDPDWAKHTLHEMKVHFQKAMILTIKDGMALPSFWDESFVHQGASTSAIPLNSASPFRIVYRTQKPYHGHIMNNDLNEKFFDEWNKGITPDHITISAVIVNDEVLGMLLGIGEKAADNKISLALTEKLATHLASHFKASNTAAA